MSMTSKLLTPAYRIFPASMRSSKPARAPLARFSHPRPRRVLRVELRDDEDLLAMTCDRFADDALGPAVRIHLGGVDERHPELDPRAKGGHFLLATAAVLAHPPCP